MHCSCITILRYTNQSRKFEKFINIPQNTKSLRRSSITPLEVFCKDFVDISYQNASFRILEAFHGCSLSIFNCNCILACEIYIFPFDGDTLN